MIWGLFALILIFAIVSAIAFLRSGAKPTEDSVSEAASFDIKEE